MKLKMFIVTLFLSIDSYAITKVYTVSKQRIEITTPKMWQTAPYLYGSDLKILGRVVNQTRPVISLNQTPLDSSVLNINRLEQAQNSYIEGRKKWLKKNKAQLINFFPYKISNWSGIKDIHSIGHKYVMQNKTYTEYSYFFKCSDEVFTISTLISQSQEKTQLKELNSVLHSLKCL